MSESPYPANGVGTVAADGAGAARQKQVIALVVVLVVALLAVVYFAFLRGGSGDGSNSATTASLSHRSTTSPSTTPSVSATGQAVVVPAAYPAPAGRNPFKPLVTAPEQVTGQSGGTTTASTGASLSQPSPSPTPVQSVIVVTSMPTLSPTSTPTVSTSPTPTVTVTATPSPTGLPTAGVAITLTLNAVDLTAGTADVTVVNGTTSTPYTAIKTGTVFGTYFKLVSLVSSDPSVGTVVGSADFQYGDQFVQLAQGESAQLN